MEIRKSALSDLDSIMALYARARAFMRANGNPGQWTDGYPGSGQVESDIISGCSYVCTDGGNISGTFFFSTDIEPVYLRIYEGHWLDDAPYGVVHRLASAGTVKGFGTFCLDWCFGQCGNIRIDTHADNIPMQKLLEKNGYVRCGIIYLRNGSERIAFQRNR